MAQKSHGSLQGGRQTLQGDHRNKTTVNEHLKEFEEGEKAVIKIDPSTTQGRPHIRFHGRTVTVKGKRGSAFDVEFKDGGKTKQLQIHPVHLQETGE
jgi:large subunit ribosomal protein L21e